ncbi:hypothetical protein [Paraglaciecola sp. 2405UD69-4]|uniref:hypothetical protein n=1 Tax=Paraglaciecola sp. 2405UD69-4 TaxID=3391836 RepID=UPI0039C9DC86
MPVLIYFIMFFALLAVSVKGYSQSTPTEFAEMSLQALLNVSIEDDKEQAEQQKWSFAVQLKAAEFEGYRQGSRDLSFDQVLYTPGEEERTDSNFPVVPTVINQYVKLVRLGYQVNPKLQIAAVVPIIRQETDHISSVPGYSEFLLTSDGVGDVGLMASYRLTDSPYKNWWLTTGISLPTGSIDQKGDTPRGPGDQQLPYTMQLGSGTFDFPVELSYQSIGEHEYNLNVSATIRTGRNDRNYRLGNNYELLAKYHYRLLESYKLFGAIEFSYSESIHGQDDEIVSNTAFPYAAGIVNPDLYGGKKLSVTAGGVWSYKDSFSFTSHVSKPVYQHLNGPQPKEKWRVGLQLAYFL